MLSIYIAAAWGNMEKARRVREQLKAMGHEVTSRWLDSNSTAVPTDPAVGKVEARMDIDDINKSDCFFLITDDKLKGTGHHVETGLAYAWRLRMIQAGPLTSVFQHLIKDRFDTVEQAIEHLRGW